MEACEIRRDALDFLSTLSSLSRPIEITQALGKKLASFGYHAVLISGLPDRGERIESFVIVNGWPRGWFDLYCHHSFADHDPIAAHCRKTDQPFEWADVYRRERATTREREIMDRAHDFSMINGFCVPIYSEHQFQAVVTMAGDSARLPHKVQSAIALVAIYAHRRATFCLAPQADSPCLTMREREVLTWFALGCSNSGVADRLGISGATVEAHYESAARKLRVRGRTHTVVEALRRREITL